MKKEYIYNTDAVSIRSNDETGEQIIFGWKLTNKQTI